MPAAMIDPAPIRAPFRDDRSHADQAPVLNHAAMKRDRMAHRHVLAEIDAPLLLHSMQHAVVLNVGIGADANLVHVPAQDRVHPYRCVLAENDVADDLRRLVHITCRRNRRAHSFNRSNHNFMRNVENTMPAHPA